MNAHAALRQEAERVKWPLVFRSDVGRDALELAGNPEPYKDGFGWLLTETCTHLVPPAPGASTVIEDLATAYPDGRWYFVHEHVTRVSARELCRRLRALALAAAA